MIQQQLEQVEDYSVYNRWSRLLWDVDHLRVEGEGLREPEGVRVIFVIISKLLTLNKTKGFELNSAS